MKREEIYSSYIKLLKEELVPATGCTEPIAIAYCASLAKKVLDAVPDKVEIGVSGNILKNVKSVIVPNTDGMKGIKSAVSAGIASGNADRGLQVISSLSKEEIAQIREYHKTADISVYHAGSPFALDITVKAFKGEHSCVVRIASTHTNVVYIEKDGHVIKDTTSELENIAAPVDETFLTVESIIDFADNTELTQLEDVLKRQIDYNTAIAEEGLSKHYGAGIGRMLLDDFGDDIRNVAKAYAAAGSDARMSGCEKPVVIVSGSGNQGMTASLPVIKYAQKLGASKEQLYRALIVSNLVTIEQKKGIGRLSAYCGAVSAGCGAGAGIAYLMGGKYDMISHTIVNALAIISGTICDGAKPSCAAKIAASVDAGIMGLHMYKNHRQFVNGEGIVSDSVDSTILNIGTLARDGMKETDKTIIKIMAQDSEK